MPVSKALSIQESVVPKSRKRKLLDQPQVIINRWVSIKTIRTFRPYIEGTARAYLRLKLKLSERKRKKALLSAFETIVKENIRAQNYEFYSTKELLNISLFFMLAERDIQTLKIDALTHPDQWQRNLSLRVMLLVMHEWDMSKVASARKMNRIYEHAGIGHPLREEMALALRKMNRAQVAARKLLAHLRHSTIAHRDADALRQYRTIMDLDTLKTLKILASFYEAVDLFNVALPKLMIDSSRPLSLLKQYGKNA